MGISLNTHCTLLYTFVVHYTSYGVQGNGTGGKLLLGGGEQRSEANVMHVE